MSTSIYTKLTRGLVIEINRTAKDLAGQMSDDEKAWLARDSGASRHDAEVWFGDAPGRAGLLPLSDRVIGSDLGTIPPELEGRAIFGLYIAGRGFDQDPSEGRITRHYREVPESGSLQDSISLIRNYIDRTTDKGLDDRWRHIDMSYNDEDGYHLEVDYDYGYGDEK